MDVKPVTLGAASALTATAFTGVLLVLPPLLVIHFCQRVVEVTADVVDAALAIWADEIAAGFEELA